MPTALALLSSALAGVFLLFAAGVGTAALQDYQEGVRPMLAAVAGAFVLLATRFILATAAWLRGRVGVDWFRPIARSMLAVIAGVGLLVAGYLFLAAAPGDPSFSDSWAEVIAATLGLWLGLMALAALGERLCWLVAGAACVVLLVASVAVSIWHGH